LKGSVAIYLALSEVPLTPHFRTATTRANQHGFLHSGKINHNDFAESLASTV
jgi:hypothetical protein